MKVLLIVRKAHMHELTFNEGEEVHTLESRLLFLTTSIFFYGERRREGLKEANEAKEAIDAIHRSHSLVNV